MIEGFHWRVLTNRLWILIIALSTWNDEQTLQNQLIKKKYQIRGETEGKRAKKNVRPNKRRWIR